MTPLRLRRPWPQHGRRTCLAVLALLGLAGPGIHASARPPNIVLLLVDDLRWDTLGHVGYPVRTPGIDLLAAEGVRFENAFVTTSICSPSRASFLTGVYPHVHGVTGNATDPNVSKVPFLNRLLEKRGYRTGLIGKWHIGSEFNPPPRDDRWFALLGQGTYGDPLFNDDGTTVMRPGYSTDIITDEAERFILRNRTQPFFLHVAYKAVHDPREPAPRHVGLYANQDWPRRPNASSTMADLRQRDAETLQSVDDSVTRIYGLLKALGLLDNTFLIFTSDNGYHFGEHGRTDKRLFFEESIRVPWIIRFPPSIEAGSVRTQPVLNIDLVPTVLDLLDAEVPRHVQGRSMMPLFDDADAPWRTEWLYEYYRDLQFPQLSSMLAVRTERFKYVEFPEGPDMWCFFGGEPLLFDLESDPYERVNVADDPDYAGVRQEMQTRMNGYRSDPKFRMFPIGEREARERVQFLAATNHGFGVNLRRYYPAGFQGFGSRVCSGTYW